MNTTDIARENLQNLATNSYPGRGLILGSDETCEYAVQVSWIMGRSENSRNRVYSHDNAGRVFTEAADPAKMKDPSLIIYNAMGENNNGIFAVSNGKQTDAATNPKDGGLSSLDAIIGDGFRYEPDAPNYTPRITGVFTIDRSISTEIILLKKSPWGDACDIALYKYSRLGPGMGYCVTTYDGDGDPLPSFQGAPYLLPLAGDMETIAQTLWNTLNAENRVALAVKMIGIATGTSSVHIVNRYEKVVAKDTVAP